MKSFYLKGGVLVADMLAQPHRATRDIDFLRWRGSPDEDELREIFKEITARPINDGIEFKSVKAEPRREEEMYTRVRDWRSKE